MVQNVFIVTREEKGYNVNGVVHYSEQTSNIAVFATCEDAEEHIKECKEVDLEEAHVGNIIRYNIEVFGVYM